MHHNTRTPDFFSTQSRVCRMLEVTVEESARDGDAWLVRWRLTNNGSSALHVTSAWVPHGRFRGASGRVPLDLRLAPGEETSLALRVFASEPRGSVVENAFLILTTNAGRAFCRMRILFQPD